MATIYYRTSLTGGTAVDLDEEDGDNLTDGDLALVADGTDIYFYILDADGGAAESSPSVIVPDTNPGTKNWVLQNVYSVTSGVTPPSGVEITGNIAGMVMSNDTDTDHDIAISAGACMDSTNIYHMANAAVVTKQIDAAWAAGDDAGGLLNGSVAANELYHVYALRKDADATADFGFLDQDDAIGTYLPAGYTYYRWIGFVLTDASSNIRNFVHVKGDVIVLNSAFEILTNVNTASLTSSDISGFIPAGRTEFVTIGANDNASEGLIDIGPNATEAEIELQAAGLTTWAGILTAASVATAIAEVHPTSAGAIYVDSNSVSTDIWLKAVKIIR